VADYPRLYVEFLHYFNVERDYYECHEVLEELWLEEGRDLFWQGLLQVAVGFHHFRNGNLGGARKLFAAAMEKLREYDEPVRMGIDLDQVKRETESRLTGLMQTGDTFPEFVPFKIRVVDPQLVALLEERKRRNTPKSGDS
jgi:hypothetical protein